MQKLIDKPLADLCQMLRGLPWLKNIYGRCYTYTDTANKNRKLPVVYSQGGDYQMLVPSEMHGNTSFFVVDPESKYSHRVGFPGIVTSQVGLIVWVNVNEVNNSYDTEDVKAQLLSAVRGFMSADSEVMVTGISEGLKAVYKEFDTNFSDQPDMYPFYAVRINMTIKYKEIC